MQDIVQAIGTVGFPIVCCLLLGYYVKYMTDKNAASIQTITEQHRTEMNAVVAALNNNTLALTELKTSLIERGYQEEK